ncbi:hypothetical protein [Pseudoduganella sp. HUAS MS19]
MKRLTMLLCWLALALPAFAAPGAHGPNGEHLDGPATTAGTDSIPRVETFTEAFELVGHLSGGELSILVDRYDTNEPVLNGKLEVQYQGMKAQARFHSAIGDYAVDDAKLLQALSAPGKHQLLFTLVAGEESDLLEGTLQVPDSAGHGHAGVSRRMYALAAAVLLLLAGALLLRRKLSTSKR